MKTSITVGKKYVATNADGVQIIGVVTKVGSSTIEFGKSGRVYIMPAGWTFEEAK